MKKLLRSAIVLICCMSGMPSLWAQGTIDFNTGITLNTYLTNNLVVTSPGGAQYKFAFNNASATGNSFCDCPNYQVTVDAFSPNVTPALAFFSNKSNTSDKLTITNNDGVSSFRLASFEIGFVARGGTYTLNGFDGSGTLVATQQFTSNGGNSPYLISPNASFNNVFRVELTSDNATGLFCGIDNVVIGPVPVATAPKVTSATYDASTGTLVVTGTDFVSQAGAQNDIDVTKIVLKGEGGFTNAYRLTTATENVEISSATEFTIVLNVSDKNGVNRILNKNGTVAIDGTNAFSIESYAGYMPGSGAYDNIESSTVTVSNVSAPVITSVEYTKLGNALSINGSGFVTKGAGGNDDIVPSKIKIKGEDGVEYTLTNSNTDINNASSFSIPLSAVDREKVNIMLNKEGTQSLGGTTYTIDIAAGLIAAGGGMGASYSGTLTVNDLIVPTVSATAINMTTGQMAITGTGFVHLSGANNDVDLSKITVKGKGSNTVTLTGNVEVFSTTGVKVTLSPADLSALTTILDRNGTQSSDAVTYNMAFADLWHPAIATGAFPTKSLTVAGIVPTITSVAYNAGTGVLTATGYGFTALSGGVNDVSIPKFTITGEGGATYTLTSNTKNVEIVNNFTIAFTLGGTDKERVNRILNTNGSSSLDGTTFNLAAAAGFNASFAATADPSTPITVSNKPAPGIGSITYDKGNNQLTVTGTNFVSRGNGGNDDIAVDKITLSGESGQTYTLTIASTANVDILSTTAFKLTLGATDAEKVNIMLNKGSVFSTSGSAYNIAFAANWLAAGGGLGASALSNALSVTNVPAPTLTSATYSAASNQLVVTGANFVGKDGSSNDIDPSKLLLTGDGNTTTAITSATAQVEILSTTGFTITLASTDWTKINTYFNQTGTTSLGNTTYNLGGNAGWMPGYGDAGSTTDLSNNPVNVTALATVTVISAAYNASAGTLQVAGTGFVANGGAGNDDIDVTKLQLLGENASSFTLTSNTSSADIINSTGFMLTLGSGDRDRVERILNKNGTTSAGANTYNLTASAGFLTASPGASDDDLIAPVAVSNVAAPGVISATYNKADGKLTIAGTGFASNGGGGTADIDLTKISITGEVRNGAAYRLGANASVSKEITSTQLIELTLTGADKDSVDVYFNKDGTTAKSGSAYNIAVENGWITAKTGVGEVLTTTLAVSGLAKPTISSMVWDDALNTLALTGANFVHNLGDNNDIDVTKFTVSGEGLSAGLSSQTLNVDVRSTTTATITIAGSDIGKVSPMMNRNGSSSKNNDAYLAQATDNWMPGYTGGASTDFTNVPITVQNLQDAQISPTGSLYDVGAGVLTITGVYFKANAGTNNDIDLSKINLWGEGSTTPLSFTGATASADVLSDKQVVIQLAAQDRVNAAKLFTRNSTVSTSGTPYRLFATSGWMQGYTGGNTYNDGYSGGGELYPGSNGIAVSGIPKPTITIPFYDATARKLTVRGTGFLAKSGANNDVTVSGKFLLTGEGGAQVLLTTATSNVEILSSTEFVINIGANDYAGINPNPLMPFIFNKEGGISTSGTPYQFRAFDNWNAGAYDGDDDISAIVGMNVTQLPKPQMLSSGTTLNMITGDLTVKIVNGSRLAGQKNDIDPTKLVLTGYGNSTYRLSADAVASDIILSGGTQQFTITLSGADLSAAKDLFNKTGLTAIDGTTYNIVADDGWNKGSGYLGGIEDASAHALNVTALAVPTVSSATYDALTGTLTVLGSNFAKLPGAANDIDVTKFVLEGEQAYQLSSTTSNVEIESDTKFTITLSAFDKGIANSFMNKNGLTYTSGSMYNLRLFDRWSAGSDPNQNTSLPGNAMEVFNVPKPTITAASYDVTSGVLTVTGSGILFLNSGSPNIIVSKLVISGEGGITRTLTSADVQQFSPNLFALTLNAADREALSKSLNVTGTLAHSGNAYNISAADDWNTGADNTLDISDNVNTLSVTGVSLPAITNAVYDANSGVLTVTGTGFVSAAGAANDVVVNRLTVKGHEAGTRTLTSNSVDIISSTQFAVQLNTADKAAVNILLDKDGVSATDGNLYNLSAAEDWMAGTSDALVIEDLSSNAITASNTISAEAKLSALSISAGVLTPSFAGGTYAYSTTVTNSINTTTITASAIESTAVITVNNITVTAGVASGALSLSVGLNTITIVSIAPNGISSKTYTVSVTRMPNSNADLSALVMSDGTFAPSFSAATVSYTVNVGNLTTTVTATPTTAETTSVVRVNGVTVTSGVASPAVALAVGSNNLSVTVIAEDGVTSKTYNVAVIRAQSGDASLSALGVSDGTLSPSFSKFTTAYTVAVSNFTPTVTISPTVTEATATVAVNGITVTSGSSSNPISLNVGSNPNSVVVTAQNGTTKTYIIDITRALNPNPNLSALDVSEGSLSPVFAQTTTTYTVAVGNFTNTITVTPTTAEPTSTVTVNGLSAVSGVASAPIPLNVGSNTIAVIVTSASGATKNYTITASRASNADAGLSNLVLSEGSLSPSFSRFTTAYTVAVGNFTNTITVTPTTVETTSTVTVNGITITSGNASGAIALNTGSNVITITVTAQNGTTKTYTVTVTRARNGNANLSALSLSQGTLSPSFSSFTTSYIAAVGNFTNTLTVTPATAEATSTVTVNGITVTSGGASEAISLSVGTNMINVVVTAENGTSKLYTISVTRAQNGVATLSALVISDGSLSPSFSSFTTSYAVAVSNFTSTITVTPTPAETTSAITVNGITVTGGTASGAIALNLGANPISVVVTAQNGTSKTYTINVARALNANANLSGLSVSVGTLSPSFNQLTTAYTVAAGNLTHTITITPTAAETTSTVTVNGITVTSGVASGAISLNVGSNPVNVVVTAASGAMKTYTINVSRASNANTNLSALLVSEGTLNPSFSFATTAYTVAVGNLTNTITVTPTAAEITSTITVNGITVTGGTASGAISLSVGSNNIYVVVTAQDGGSKTYTINVNRAKNANTNLSSLAVNQGSLSPSFSLLTTAYTVTVGNLTNTITVTPTAAETTSTITVNGITVTGGTASGAISLSVGSNNIYVVVTAQDGSSKTYTINVTRAQGSNADLATLRTSAGAVNPVFAATTTAYTVAVANLMATITVTASSAEITSAIFVNGITVTSGAPSGAISLAVGNNTINVVVIAADGVTRKTYTINAIRAAAADPSLQSVVLSSGSLSPAFASATTLYDVAIGVNEANVTLTPTATDPTSIITVNGITTVTGSGIRITTPDDVNTATIVVTTADESSTKTYSITLTKPKTTWKGAIVNGWNAAANWTNGLPSTAKLTVIPNVSNRPFITTNETVGTIQVDAGAVLSITGSLQVTGNITHNGSIVGTGTVIFSGAASQTIAGNGTYNHVTVSNQNGITIAAGQGNTMEISGVLTLGANVILNTNGNLLLKSDANGTAGVAPLPSTAKFNGTVTAQNWIRGQRGYRALAHPFSNGLALNQLTDNFAVSGSGSGFASGLGYSTASVSYYDSAAFNPLEFKKPLSNAPNTSSATVWTQMRGILALVRGAGTEGLSMYDNPAQPSAFAMDATGNLSTGALPDYVLGANANGSSFNLVGNPYAAPINIRLLKSNGGVAMNANNGATGVANTIYVYNPFKNAGITATPSQEIRGGLDAYTNDGNTDIIIPPFGAFFVQAKAAGNVIKFDENVKAIGSAPIAMMGGNDKARLTLVIENKRGSWDDIKFRWDDKAGAAGTDVYDGTKLGNELLDFYSIASDQRQLCIDSRNSAMSEETIPLGIATQVTDASFRIKVSLYDMPSNIQVYLLDKLMGTETLLSKTDDGYAFAITADESTKGNQRFELVFRQVKVVAPTDPVASSEVHITPNPFTDDLNIQLAPDAVSATGTTHVRMISMDGRTVKTITAAPGASQIKVRARDLSPGAYIVEVSNDKVKTTKQVIKQ